MEDKADQHKGWGRGILAVIHDWGETADDFRDGMARRDSWPWWRVYWIDAAPPPVLIWQQPNSRV